MQIIKINPVLHNQEIINLAATVLTRGGIIVCPTDTTYLLGASATNEDSVETIYSIKGRDYSKPITVIVSNIDMMKQYSIFNETAIKLSQALLPGPLTLVLEKSEAKLAPNLTKYGTTLGFRIPGLELNTKISKKLAAPYTATSANKSGEAAAYSTDEFLQTLNKDDLKKIDLILDAGQLRKVLPSSVVDCTQENATILREGAVPSDRIRKILTQTN